MGNNEFRQPQSGPFIDLDALLLPYLLKADVQVARFVPSAIELGAGERAFMTKVFGPPEWTLVNNKTLQLPRGKYFAVWCGVISKALNGTAQLALASTSGGLLRLGS